MVTAKEVGLNNQEFKKKLEEWKKMSDLEKFEWNGLKGFLLKERVSKLFAPKIHTI